MSHCPTERVNAIRTLKREGWSYQRIGDALGISAHSARYQSDHEYKRRANREAKIHQLAPDCPETRKRLREIMP